MAKVWFVRSNGNTVHNNPNDSSYVPGEPPIFPITEFNYSLKCLQEGFARFGWPNTGDRRVENPVRLAPLSYTFEAIDTRYKTYLTKFCSIRAGDLILIPADGQNRGDVHLGITLTIDRKKVLPYIEPRPNAYYYYHDILIGHWYECAHRVNVQWAKNEDSEFSVFHCKATKDVVWILAFSQVDDDGTIYNQAYKAGLF